MKTFKQFLFETSTTPETTEVVPTQSKGKAQFQTDDGEWHDASGSIPAGAPTRTGMNSSLTINPGTSNEATQQSGTVRTAPRAGEDTQDFSLKNQPNSGNANFKVNKIGLSNDFKVQSPNMVGAVRG